MKTQEIENPVKTTKKDSKKHHLDNSILNPFIMLKFIQYLDCYGIIG
jgi:hypothetical protein